MTFTKGNRVKVEFEATFGNYFQDDPDHMAWVDISPTRGHWVPSDSMSLLAEGYPPGAVCEDAHGGLWRRCFWHFDCWQNGDLAAQNNHTADGTPGPVKPLTRLVPMGES